MLRSPAAGALFRSWRAWERGVMPRAGGWLDQPLRLIITFGAMDIVAMTYRYTTKPNADLSKLSSLQDDLMRWLEGDDG